MISIFFFRSLFLINLVAGSYHGWHESYEKATMFFTIAILAEINAQRAEWMKND